MNDAWRVGAGTKFCTTHARDSERERAETKSFLHILCHVTDLNLRGGSLQSQKKKKEFFKKNMKRIGSSTHAIMIS